VLRIFCFFCGDQKMANFLFEASIFGPEDFATWSRNSAGFIVLLFTAFLGVGRLYEFPVKEKAIKG
tara:strand:+ start:467 stop:664 length:198 start_codon:yes stop_codon:yes gene_type:complete